MNLKNKNKQFFSAVSLSVLVSGILYADVSGIVFQDIPVNGTSLNSYGVKDANEIGLANVMVTAYPGGATTTTDDSGIWTLSTSSDVRVEFSNIPSHLKESVEGGAKNSSVQFVVNGGTADFALHDVNDYSNVAQPPYATNILSGGSNVDSTIPALVTNNYTDSELNAEHTNYDGVQGTGPIPITDAEAKDIGAVWGKGFQSSKQRMFISSVLWRHIGFANGSPSKIFVADYSSSPATILGNIDLQGKSGIDLGSVDRDSGSDYTLPDDPSVPSVDLDAYAKIGKISYGDLDFDNNMETIWTVNLNQKALISVDASGDYASLASATVNQYLIEGLDGVPTCTGGELRPWALAIHDGKGYLGSVCDASISQSVSDLEAFVSTFDLANPSAGLSTVFSMDMDYDRSADDGYAENPNFFAWSDDIHDTSTNWDGYNQPILADIDFDEQGNLYLGFIDRYGIQLGMSNYTAVSGSTDTAEKAYGQGEILKVCNSNGTYELEGTGSCAEGTTPDKDFFDDRGGDNNANPSGGAMAILKGSNQMILAINDPHPAGDTGSTYWTTNGVQTFSTTTGANENWYSHINSGSIEYTGKAAGIGDIELLTAAAPIEIGDRVWEDTNSDGIQDADEAGISGVTVELICGEVVASTATTDADGNYIFSNDSSGTSTASHKYNVASLVAGTTDCLVRVPNVTGTSKQTALGIASLTLANVGEGSNTNLNDSDGLAVGDNSDTSILATDIPVSGANNHSFDFGFSPKPTVSIGSLVWEDLNNDGLQDDDELGIADVNVTLLDENGTVMSNPVQKTLADGQYYFSGLDEGTYSILVSPPTGMGYVPCATQNTADNDDTENDSNIKEPKDGGYISGKFILEADTEPAESLGKSGTDTADDSSEESGNMTVDFCFYRPASLGDYVWYDDNKDGLQDATETGVDGVRVKLLIDCDEANVTATTTTNVDGKYLFSDLDAGDYCVEFSNLPIDYMVTTQGAGSATDSDVHLDTNRTATTTLAAGENDMTWDMGIYSSKVAIGDRVWYDLNKNGQQDDDETGVNGIDVKLLDATCTNELNTTTTSGDGNYIFESLPAGTYCLEFGTLEDGYVISPLDSGDDASDSDVNASTHQTVPLLLEEGTRDLTWDMGIYKPAKLGDKVWYDTNANGLQDDGELPVQGVDVTLLGSDCATAVAGVDPQTTGDDGLYLFEDLIAGDYCVRFTNIPEGYAITPQNQGDDTKDSDVNVNTGITEKITLNAGDNDITWDMGIYQEASIGDYVWNDANANGIQEDAEAVVDGVTVTLYDKTCDTVAKDSSGVNIPTATTDANGLYKFEHLMPAEYCLGFTTLPDGYGFSPENSGSDDAKDSDVNPQTGKTAPTTLDGGENDMSWDAGIFQAASIGDIVWYDKNANGTQDRGEIGVTGVTVKLYQSDCETLAVDGKGVAIGDKVTDENGHYAFSSLVPNDYCVGFDLDTLPVGYKISPKKVGADDTINSDANETTGITSSTNLVGGENDTTWDMGIYSPAAIGDRVWLDENANGVQDDNETGVKDVTVTLYEGDCATEVMLNNDGGAITPAITDVNGNYLFTNLIPAEYCVGFTDLPTNHVVSPKDNIADDAKDSDVNPATMKTIATMLESGENDPTWDMGIYVPASIGDRVWLDENGDGLQDDNETNVENVKVTLYEGDCETVVTTDDSGVAITVQTTDVNGLYNFSNLTPNEYCVGFELPAGYVLTSKDMGSDDAKDSDVNPATGKTDATTLSSGENDPTWDAGIYKPASIGDKVWNDTNGDGVQDADEVGIEGVEVKLYGCDCETPALSQDGAEIAPVMTDANGVYNFNNLQPSKYCVGFTPLDGYVLSPQNSADDDRADSDVNRDTNKTECTTLISDENDTTWDMGLYIPASIGDRVWYDLNRDGIQDSNETGVSNATVTLYTLTGSVVSTTQTDEDGNFLFDELVPNDYQLGFEVPNGYALSDSNQTNDNNDSDVNPTTRRTEITNLESGENDISWDAGIYELSSLGDYVWYDENHDGKQDADEPAVKDVKVTLYESDCSTAIAETRSDTEGKYLFENLEPNDYCVGFDELPIGYQFTPVYDNTGSGGDLDCNVDPGTGKTPVITLPLATDDMTWDMGIIPKCEDEEGRALEVFDDQVMASTTGSITTVNILANDYGNLDVESIRFVSTQEGAILWEDGTAVAGTTLETTDTLVVEGEGTWTASDDGTITFKAEDGFTGVPEPVYYVINCKQGNTSNVGKVEITSNCVCDTYEESSVPALSNINMLLILILTSILGMFFFKNELIEKK